jgi:anti-anti-sigma factor
MPVSPSISATPESAFTSHTAHFATRWPTPSIAIVTAHGEIDAANAMDFVDYVLRDADRTNGLVVDLAGIKFFGSAGFSALDTLNERCAAYGITWAIAPSKAVSRLLRICDPDTRLPVHQGLDSAIGAVTDEPRALLQLVAEPS